MFVFLFLGWQLWLNDVIVGAEQNMQAVKLGQTFTRQASPLGVPVPVPSAGFGVPVITAVGAPDEKFATVYIPRFGADYVRTVAEGVDTRVALKSGIGHYPGTQMPGEIGNFALAAHRTTFGAPFSRIASLELGDKIYIQTADGWYIYSFRSMEYVRPTSVAVTAPVPQQTGIRPADRVLTMTSCNPQLSAVERIVAYSIFDSWQPLSAGVPDAVKALAEGKV